MRLVERGERQNSIKITWGTRTNWIGIVEGDLSPRLVHLYQKDNCLKLNWASVKLLYENSIHYKINGKITEPSFESKIILNKYFEQNYDWVCRNLVKAISR